VRVGTEPWIQSPAAGVREQGQPARLGGRLIGMGVAGYQAWASPQWGQSTEVDTSAWNTNPHEHV
jgi:hypothetical protein